MLKRAEEVAEKLRQKAEAIVNLSQKIEIARQNIAECWNIVLGTELEEEFREIIADAVAEKQAFTQKSVSTFKKKRSSGDDELTYRKKMAIKDEVKRSLGLGGHRTTPKRVIDTIFDKIEGSDELVEKLKQEMASAVVSGDYTSFWLIAKEGIEKLTSASAAE